MDEVQRTIDNLLQLVELLKEFPDEHFDTSRYLYHDKPGDVRMYAEFPSSITPEEVNLSGATTLCALGVAWLHGVGGSDAVTDESWIGYSSSVFPAVTASNGGAYDYRYGYQLWRQCFGDDSLDKADAIKRIVDAVKVLQES